MGSLKFDGFCKHHAPAVSDCPVCGARGYPKYNDKCKRCAGIVEDDVPVRRDTFLKESMYSRGSDKPFIENDEFPELRKTNEKEFGF